MAQVMEQRTPQLLCFDALKGDTCVHSHWYRSLVLQGWFFWGLLESVWHPLLETLLYLTRPLLAAMAALECLKWHRFSEAQSEMMTGQAEGKGVPRFDGSPGSLQEYAFRVRLRAVRESGLDESEKKKNGPLGLRLVDGLSGGALQVVREIDLKKLAKLKKMVQSFC